MAHSRIRVRPFWKLFPLGDKARTEMSVQLARLCVLYEDLMLEISGAITAESFTLGHARVEYRRMYFARRALSTAFEMKQAIDVLAMNREFKDSLRRWSPESVARWRAAVAFFRMNQDVIRHWRNDVGAKLANAATEFSLRENVDTAGAIDAGVNRQEQFELRLEMAYSLLAGALSHRKPAADNFETYQRKTFEIISTAQIHAAHVARTITLEVFWRR